MATYDDRTALLVVDLQHDFADPGGSLYVRGGEEVLSVANREVAKATAAGALVLYTQDWHPSDTPHFEKDGGLWPVHCVGGTRGADLLPGLDVRGPVVRKGAGGEDGYSAFSVRDPKSGAEMPTGTERLLTGRGVTRLVILGLATDYCVRWTALDAIERGFDVTVLREGIRAVDLAPGDGEAALAEISSAGATVE